MQDGPTNLSNMHENHDFMKNEKHANNRIKPIIFNGSTVSEIMIFRSETIQKTIPKKNTPNTSPSSICVGQNAFRDSKNALVVEFWMPKRAQVYSKIDQTSIKKLFEKDCWK